MKRSIKFSKNLILKFYCQPVYYCRQRRLSNTHNLQLKNFNGKYLTSIFFTLGVLGPPHLLPKTTIKPDFFLLWVTLNIKVVHQPFFSRSPPVHHPFTTRWLASLGQKPCLLGPKSPAVHRSRSFCGAHWPRLHTVSAKLDLDFKGT